MRLPFAATTLGFAIAEAGVSASAAVDAELPPWACAAAALGSAAVVLVCAGCGLWALDLLLRTRGARALGGGLHRAIAAEGSFAFAWLWGAGWLGLGAATVLWIAPAFMAHMSPAFGVAATVLATVLVCALLVLVAAAAGHPLGRRLAPHSDVARALDRVLCVLAPGCAVAAALGLLVEPRYAAAPLCAAVLCAAALATPLRTREPRWPALAALSAGVALVALLERLPSTAAEVLAYRTPYASLALGLGQRPFDDDGDGAASILLGGDCDDRNPGVHPRARDVPQNGVDENCNGSDAPHYQPPRRARTRGAPSTKHDVIVLLVDALRPDRLSLAGYHRKTSPHIDALAREGTWFRNAYTTAPSTRFAMASLFTGRDVRRLRYRDLGGNNFKLNGGAPTLARRLDEAEYRTVGFTVSYVIQHNKGTGQGFDRWGTPWPIKNWRKVGGEKAAITTEAVLAQLEKTPSDERLFLFAHYDCTHAPYRKYPPHDFGDAPSDRYDSALAHCDAQIGRVLETLRARPSWERTAVFVVSDHGELFGEHGLSSHGNSLFEPDVRVALIARVPGAKPRVVDRPVQLHWVAPTVLELSGLRPHREDDAASLLGAILGTQQPERRPLFLFTELERGSMRYFASAVIDWPHKFIRDHRTGTVALYDVVEDPGERRSLIDSQPAVAGRLSDLLEAYESWAQP